jgi:IS5 family transposase
MELALINPQYPTIGTTQLFPITTLCDTLDQNNHLIIIAKAIDWQLLEANLLNKYSPGTGRPGLPIRLMIGLLLLQRFHKLSDEQVVENWRQNVYFQAFTGESQYNDRLPCDHSMLTVFMQRIGDEGCNLIFAESVHVHGPEALSEEVTIDATTQDKYTTFPTDFKLITAAIAFILRLGAFLNINFPKTFVKERKDLKSKINFGRSKIALEKKTEYINRLREIGNILLKQLRFSLSKYYWKLNPITKLMRTLEKAINQKRDSKNKVYSVCEPQISCIAKGKAGVPYEFGTKVSFVISTTKISFSRP